MYQLLNKAPGLIIGLEEVKKYLKVEHSLEDSIISMMINSAEDTANKYMLRYIRETTFKYFGGTSNGFLVLRRARFKSIVSIKDLTSDSQEELEYKIRPCTDIYGQILFDRDYTDLEVVFKVGEPEEEDEKGNKFLSHSLKQAVLIIIANMFENRGDDEAYSIIPPMAKQILDGYRVIRAV